MTSAKSCKNPERTWFLEILRRCKVLPVLLAVAYFFSNILPIMLSYSRFERIASFAYSSMTGQNLLNIALAVAGGVVLSCAVFRYLHSSDSVIDAHSKPLTRTQLFRGSFFAGLVMVVAPVVLTGLFYLCVMGAHGSLDISKLLEGLNDDMDASHILTAGHIFGWTLDNIIMIGFTYCVSCLAAILAGTAAIQALLSLLLVSLPTILYAFYLGYMETFLYGFSTSNSGSISRLLSPYVYLMLRGEYPFATVPAALIVYLLISALIAFAAMLIYRKVKLEKEEQTIVVPFVAEFLVIVLTALAVSTVLFIARQFLSIESDGGAVITIILATVVFFPIFCMIADQSFRIFKSRNAGVFIIYAAVMCLALAFTLFDMSGYEKKVPEVSEVESVFICDNNMTVTDFDLSDEEAIAKVTALHESIAEVGDQMYNNYYGEDEQAINGKTVSISGIDVIYKLKNGRTMARTYPTIYYDSFDRYADYYSSKAVRKHECMDENNPLLPGQYMSMSDRHVDSEGNNIDLNIYKVPDKNMKGLVKAANKDIMNWTAESQRLFDYIDVYDPAKDKSAYSIDINTDYSNKSVNPADTEGYCRYYMFTTDDRNIVKYMENHPEIMSEDNIIPEDDPMFGDDVDLD